MNISIIGLGAIGSLWAYHLHQAGHNVNVWTRQPHASSHSSLALQLGENPVIHLAHNNSQALAESELVIVCVKAWQVQEAILPLLTILTPIGKKPDTILLFLHNGMGAVDLIAQHINAYPVVIATTTHASIKLKAPIADQDQQGLDNLHQVQHTGIGQTQIGAYNQQGQRCSFLAAVLGHALAPVYWHEHIEQALWNKLAINCVINPLTALLQSQNKVLIQPQYQPQLKLILLEVANVMQAEGVLTNIEPLEQMVTQVINATAENYSSMQQDLFYRRPTEIDFITGYLLKIAAKHHIKTPQNQALYEKIITASRYC